MKLLNVTLVPKLVEDNMEIAYFGEEGSKDKRDMVMFTENIINCGEILENKKMTIMFDTVNGMLCITTKIDDAMYVSYDTSRIHDAILDCPNLEDDLKPSASMYYEAMYKKGISPRDSKNLAFIKEGGRLGPYTGYMENGQLSDSQIYVKREGEYVEDNTINNVYAELSRMNKHWGDDKTKKEIVNELLRSLSTKATELLLPVMGDSVGVLARRLMTFDTLLTYASKEFPEQIQDILQGFVDDVADDIDHMDNSELTPLMIANLKDGLDYRKRIELAEVIHEEKQMIKDLIAEGEPIKRKPNPIDLAFVNEMLDNVMAPKEDADTKDSYAKGTFHMFVFATDAIVAGARAMDCVRKSLMTDYKWADGDMGPAIEATRKNSNNNVLMDVFDFLDDEIGDEIDTRLLYKQYTIGDKTFAQDFRESLGLSNNNDSLREVFHGNSKGYSKKLSESISSITSNSKYSKKKKYDDEDEDDRRGNSKIKRKGDRGDMRLGINEREDVEEMYLDGDLVYVDYNDKSKYGYAVYEDRRLKNYIGDVDKNDEVYDERGKFVGELKERPSRKKSRWDDEDDNRRSSRGGRNSGRGNRSSRGGRNSDRNSGRNSGRGRYDEDDYNDDLQEISIEDKRGTFFIDLGAVTRFDGEKCCEVIDKRDTLIGYIFSDEEVVDVDGYSLGFAEVIKNRSERGIRNLRDERGYSRRNNNRYEDEDDRSFRLIDRNRNNSGTRYTSSMSIN